jgi:hypothetical protein
MPMARAAVLVAALAWGCSSTSNQPSPRDSSIPFDGPPPTTRLLDLSAADLKKLCLHDSPDGTGIVSCSGGTAALGVLGVCTSVTASCTATVATAQTCAARLTADACNSKAYMADMSTPECLVMRDCLNILCNTSACYCPDDATRTSCLHACQSYAGGLTIECSTCIAGLFQGLQCPNFLPLESPYAECASACVLHDAGVGNTDAASHG